MQVGSSLLTDYENNLVLELFKPRNRVLSLTVAQIYTTENSEGTEWIYKTTGVLCFVKDSEQRSFYFRVYSIEAYAMIWECEIYVDMIYNSGVPFFHMFEGETCIIGFNFANESEAVIFAATVKKRLDTWKNSRKKHKELINNQQLFLKTVDIPNPLIKNLQNIQIPQQPQSIGKKKFKTTLPRKKKKINREQLKAQISGPSNYEHKQHIGFTVEKGIEVRGITDPTIKNLLKMIKINEDDMKDKKNIKIIQQAIQDCGGAEFVTKRFEQEKLQERVFERYVQHHQISANKAMQINMNNKTTSTPPPTPPRNSTKISFPRSISDQNEKRSKSPSPPKIPPPNLPLEYCERSQTPPPISPRKLTNVMPSFSSSKLYSVMSGMSRHDKIDVESPVASGKWRPINSLYDSSPRSPIEINTELTNPIPPPPPMTLFEKKINFNANENTNEDNYEDSEDEKTDNHQNLFQEIRKGVTLRHVKSIKTENIKSGSKIANILAEAIKKRATDMKDSDEDSDEDSDQNNYSNEEWSD